MLELAPLLLLFLLAIACGLAFAGVRGAAELFTPRKKLTAPLLAAALLALLAPLLGGAALGAPGGSWMNFVRCGYDVGFAHIAVLFGLWLAVALWWFTLAPIQSRLTTTSTWEYLERRFSPTVRRTAGFGWILWQVVALVFSLAAFGGCVEGVEAALPGWLLTFLLGLAATGAATLGGFRAAVAVGAISAAFFVGVFGAATLLATQQAGGVEAVLETAGRFGRSASPGEWEFATWHTALLAGTWTAIAVFAWLAVDPLAGARLVAARSLNDLRGAALGAALGASAIVGTGTWSGSALFAWLHENPSAVWPRWVVNVDPLTGDTLRDETGSPLTEWHEPLDHDHLAEVVIPEGRLMHPNRREPVTELGEFLDGETGALRYDLLAVRRPPPVGVLGNGELVLHRRARGELAFGLAAELWPTGGRALLLAAIAAQLLSLAVAASQGFGAVWLLEVRGLQLPAPARPAEAQSVPGWFHRARLATLVTGLGCTLLACALTKFSVETVRAAALWITPLCPLAAVVLLGLLWRSLAPHAALTGMLLGWIGGLLAAIFLNGDWVLAATPLAGLLALFTAPLANLLPGPHKRRDQLRGLVWGIGRLGERAPEELSPAIEIPEEDSRWR